MTLPLNYVHGVKFKGLPGNQAVVHLPEQKGAALGSRGAWAPHSFVQASVSIRPGFSHTCIRGPLPLSLWGCRAVWSVGASWHER